MRLSKWRAAIGMQHVSDFIAALPMLAPLVDGLVARPHSGGSYVLEYFCPVRKIIPRMVSLLATPGYAVVKDKLAQYFNGIHNEKTHSAQETFEEEKKKSNVKPSCLDAG
eukprot:9034610-Pyramimonas_sp.AAC.1